MKKGENMEIQ